jgi:hypothetical protein
VGHAHVKSDEPVLATPQENRQKQIDHLLCPGVFAKFRERPQFAYMMGIAQRMLAVRVKAELRVRLRVAQSRQIRHLVHASYHQHTTYFSTTNHVSVCPLIHGVWLNRYEANRLPYGRDRLRNLLGRVSAQHKRWLSFAARTAASRSSNTKIKPSNREISLAMSGWVSSSRLYR